MRTKEREGTHTRSNACERQDEQCTPWGKSVEAPVLMWLVTAVPLFVTKPTDKLEAAVCTYTLST